MKLVECDICWHPWGQNSYLLNVTTLVLGQRHSAWPFIVLYLLELDFAAMAKVE